MTVKSVFLFSKDDCVNCDSTKRHFERLNVDYTEFNIDHDENAREQLKALGFRGAPVVVTPEGAWAGYKPEKIEEVFGS